MADDIQFDGSTPVSPSRVPFIARLRRQKCKRFPITFPIEFWLYQLILSDNAEPLVAFRGIVTFSSAAKDVSGIVWTIDGFMDYYTELPRDLLKCWHHVVVLPVSGATTMMANALARASDKSTRRKSK